MRSHNLSALNYVRKERNAMRICDMKEEDIVIGLRVRGLKTGKLGTIVKSETKGSETYHFILWDGELEPNSGFYWNDCECEVVNPPKKYHEGQ